MEQNYKAIDRMIKALEGEESEACDTLYFCPDCEEEYTLPEDTEMCPICRTGKLEVLS